MNREIARVLIDQKLNELRRFSYRELLTLIDRSSNSSLKGKDDVEYQLEVQAFWDTKKDGNIRVMVTVDDGGGRAIAPLSGDFIITPEGSFIGETS
jgi:hypothetical protein